MRSALVVMVVAGCSFGSDEPIANTIENEGQICLFASAPSLTAQMFAENTPVIVRYSTTGCLSQSCDIERVASCSATRTDGTVAVTSSATWSDVSRTANACTADCGQITAQCTTDALPAGTYTFALGAASLSLAVPSTANQAPCAETP